MEIITRFLEWKENQKTTIRGNNLYYDVKGYYKYLQENELFDYYLKTKEKL